MDFFYIFELLKSGVVFLFILGVVVLIHELGHFIAAKLIGVKVPEFAFGFGPSLWKRQYGETLYKWNLLPLGGYCKMLGEGDDINEEGSFSTKSPIQKIFVLVSGVLMNFILAIIIFTTFFTLNNWSLRLETSLTSPDYTFHGADGVVMIGSLAPGDSPAKTANVPTGVIVRKIGDVKIDNYKTFVNEVGANFGKTLSLVVEDPNSAKQTTYMVLDNTKNETGRAVIGVGLVYYIDYSNSKLLSGIYHSYDTVVYNILGLKQVYQRSVDDGNLQYASESTGSIVKIAQITHSLVRTDNWIGLLYWGGLISASLSFMNLLPIPALDGGHIFIIILEAVLRRKFSENTKGKIALGGFAFLMILFAVLFIKDILDLSMVKNLVKMVWK